MYHILSVENYLQSKLFTFLSEIVPMYKHPLMNQQQLCAVDHRTASLACTGTPLYFPVKAKNNNSLSACSLSIFTDLQFREGQHIQLNPFTTKDLPLTSKIVWR